MFTIYFAIAFILKMFQTIKEIDGEKLKNSTIEMSLHYVQNKKRIEQ